MTKHTIEEIKNRIESAVYVMKLLPPVRARGYRSAMPDIIYTPQEIVFMDRKPLKPRPTQEQISQMDEVLEWLEVLEPWERKLVWKRGARIPWKFLCREFGVCRSNINKKYDIAIMKILYFLK